MDRRKQRGPLDSRQNKRPVDRSSFRSHRPRLSLVEDRRPAREVDVAHVKRQMQEFGICTEAIEKIMAKIGEDQGLAYVALRNLHLMDGKFKYEDVGQYISIRPNYVTMQSAMLARCIGMDPRRIRMTIPEQLKTTIIKKRKIEDESVVDEQTRKNRRKIEEAKRAMEKHGVDVGTAHFVMQSFSANGIDPQTLAKNVAKALESMSREDVLQLIRDKQTVRSLSPQELEAAIEGFKMRKLARMIQADIPRTNVSRNTLMETARICKDEAGVIKLIEKILYLRAYVEDNSIEYGKLSRFLRSNLTAMATKPDLDYLVSMFEEYLESEEQKCSIKESIDKLKHAKKHRLRGIDVKGLIILLNDCGFKIVTTKRGGSHQRIEYDGEIAKNKQGRPVVVMIKTGDLAYGTAADILGKLIGFLQRKRKLINGSA
jgi:hypothetical protein